ncbi:AMP-binding protein, partial [Methanoculleus sp. UBA413]
MADDEEKPMSYEDLCANFKIDVPEYYNFGFDVIDAWAKKDRNRLAMIWTDQKGNEKKYTFFDLMRLSNQAVNICIKYGIKKGDRVMLMLPRTPEWWIFVIALIKLGAVYCPATTMLTPKDLEYRIQAANIRMIITMAEHADKVEEIRDECPTLRVRLMIDGTRDGWVSYPVELDYPAPCSHKLVNLPGLHRTKSTDPLLIFFTSGTTGEPKMVVHDHSYPLGHLVTARVWHDLHGNDLHLTISDTGWGKSAWGKL